MHVHGAPHSFHIPVMGTGFTIDTPLRVARFGIASVVSIVDDRLAERMRLHYAERAGEDVLPIGEREPDARARRIRAYLDLLVRRVGAQSRRLRAEAFAPGTEITRYFELLDEDSPLKREYLRYLLLPEGPERRGVEAFLRSAAVPGAIDVNIMTKVDRVRGGVGDARAALRGFAESALEGSVVFSAGFNPALYAEIERHDGFYPDPEGRVSKRVTLKVSDFRSAFTQARWLAKKGIWVSEFRLESGLNCGGHAFPTDGILMGPALEEFAARRRELLETVHPLYVKALSGRSCAGAPAAPEFRLSAQGGIGTSAEGRFLVRKFGLASVGWGTPFLLVPEATCVDSDTLEKLLGAEEGDVYLSGSSPLGVPFYNLRRSASEEARRARADAGRPGSACGAGYLAFDTEFGEELCPASARYQAAKLLRLREELGEGDAFEAARSRVVEKSCLCRDLGSGALVRHGLSTAAAVSPAVCPGPNLVFFKRIASLKEMVDHVYGRLNLLSGKPRPHVFVNELRLYAGYLKKRLRETEGRERAALGTFRENLLSGVRYYRDLAADMVEETPAAVGEFLSHLAALDDEIRAIAV